MNQPAKAFTVQSQAISDRGLNERRPLNEDSFLADSRRFIFAVADGVGGAEAGEVASKTAIEVLDEAFRHQVAGEDVEDLMELAIQRANASIHQMAKEHAKFAMMATTIVCLHLNGNIATIGHVGDSRLYRLTPEGELVRDTEDHSVVEEEVRAGRMTAEQAANHPSKNVISRALGAEDSVEVDLKTIEIEDGTEFLLCTDGITRHISDNELRQLLVTEENLQALCEELKQRCYERGAEDNLTAVVVRCGQRIASDRRHEDLQKTISPETEWVHNKSTEYEKALEGNLDITDDPLVPAFSRAFPATANREEEQINTPEQKLNIPAAPAAKGGFMRTLGRLFMLVLFVATAVGAFYTGRRYKGPIPFVASIAPSLAEPQPSQSPTVEDPFLSFERARRSVDADPQKWLAFVPREVTAQGIQNPLESSDPQFLYLYGRASLLAGNNDEAARAFEQAIVKSDANPSPANLTVRREATLALAALAIKSDKERQRALTRFDEMLQKPSNTNSP
ncbi:MAG: PP2C family protein-serine/threonine phosphatase [Pyrinomonadaceae bacterium]